MEKHVSANDYCDLEPTKVCDNCCRCIDRDGEAYHAVMADLETLLNEDYVLDDVNALNEPMERPNIDPELLAEWEEKLRIMEAEERAAEQAASKRKHSDELLLELDFEEDLKD